jgi:hypothetical protein
MARPEKANWLDEAIARTVPGRPPEPDFDAWRHRHAHALETLTQRAQRKTRHDGPLPTVIAFGRELMRHPITRLAAAALLAVAVFVLAKHLSGRETPAPTSAPRVVQTPRDDQTGIATDPSAQLVRAKALFAQGDVSGLLALLETGRYGTKIEVAGCLEQIGDASALATLESLAAQWQGAADANPFQKAIDAIHRRQEPSTEPLTEPERVEPNAVSERLTGQAPPGDSTTTSHPSVSPPSARTDLLTYEGRVVDDANSAVSEVHVWVQTISNTFRTSILSEEAFTDRDGGFRLTTTRPATGKEVFRILRFDHPDYGMGWRSLDRPSEAPQDIQVTLHAPATVSGVVVDDQDQPIANARVEADVFLSAENPPDMLMLWDLLDTASYTDDHGRFVLDRLPAPATLRLRISASGYALYATDSDSSSGPFTLRAGDGDLRITLDPGSAIAGRIVYEDGTPYKHRAVAMVEGPGAHELIFAAKDDGTFTSPGLSPGLYHINVLKDEFKPLCTPSQVQVRLAETPSEVVLKVLPAEQPVAVQIVDENTGEPLQDVWVRAEFAEGPEGSVGQARTDATGLCTLPMPPGRYRIAAQGWENGRFADFAEELTLEPEQTDAVVIIAITARANITGRLVDAKGHPVEGFVQIDSSDRSETDSDGRFSVAEPFGDTFKYRIAWAYDQTQHIGKMFLFRKADYTGELVLVLEPCATLTGRIVNQAGQPQTDIRPRLGVQTPGGGASYHSEAAWGVTVDKKGHFAIEKVPVGISLQVSAERKGLQGHTSAGDLRPGQIHDVGDIVLRGTGGIDENTDWTGVLEGTITDENNKPVRKARVSVYADIDSFEAVTDRRGHFKFTGLPKGVRLNFDLCLPDDGDMQILPQGWELLGEPAPPLSIAKWYNSEPLTLAELRGKVVLLQIGVLLPLYGDDLTTMQKVARKYADQGLVTIAVHQPLDVTWGGKVTEDDLQKFVNEGNVPFVFCLDKDQQTRGAYTDQEKSLRAC